MANYSIDEIVDVLEYGMNDNFWQDKLLKPESIKRNFETIRMQMLKDKEKEKSKEIETDVETDEPILGFM
jgi:hypothetical protein